MTNLGLNAVEGADGGYVVQPVTATIQVTYPTVAYRFMVTISNPITTYNTTIPLPGTTLEGVEVVDRPLRTPSDDEQESGTPSPTPPSSPPAEDPPLTPVNNDPPQDRQTPSDNTPPVAVAPPETEKNYVVLYRRVTTVVQSGIVPGMPLWFDKLTILEPRTVYNTQRRLITLGNGEVIFALEDDDQAPASPGTPPAEEPPLTPVSNEPSPPPVSSLGGKIMTYMPPWAHIVPQPDGTTATLVTGSSFSENTYAPSKKPGNNIVDTVSVNITSDYGNSVFVIENGSMAGAITKYIHTIAITSGDVNLFGSFLYRQVEWTSSGVKIPLMRTFPSALDFFCGRGLVTVLNHIAKRTFLCGVAGQSKVAYRPNKSDIASGALQDIGARGFGFADSPARFYARWGNKEKRKQAGFSYNFDTFALRTDYNKLPAAQDAKVMLDTYRVGIMPDIGKRHRLFAGVDNYRNGILAIQYSDAADDDTHTNIYKLGSVAGKGGYAVKFEWRIVWD